MANEHKEQNPKFVDLFSSSTPAFYNGKYKYNTTISQNLETNKTTFHLQKLYLCTHDDKFKVSDYCRIHLTPEVFVNLIQILTAAQSFALGNDLLKCAIPDESNTDGARTTAATTTGYAQSIPKPDGIDGSSAGSQRYLNIFYKHV
jgi:hypothetical protein